MNYLKENWFVILFVIVLYVVSIIPQTFKELFVEMTGNIKMIGHTLGLLMAIFIFYRWKYARLVFNIIIITTCLADLFLLTNVAQKFLINSLCLFVLHLGLLIVFTYSKKSRLIYI